MIEVRNPVVESSGKLLELEEKKIFLVSQNVCLNFLKISYVPLYIMMYEKTLPSF